ncbi:MAG: hypothetical protein V1928_03010 [Parcubacteria group bacterium]
MFNEKQWKLWNKIYIAAMILFYFSLAMIVLCAIFHPPYLPSPIACGFFAGLIMGYSWKQMKTVVLESTLNSELSIKEIKHEQNTLKDRLEVLKPAVRDERESTEQTKPTIH